MIVGKTAASLLLAASQAAAASAPPRVTVEPAVAPARASAGWARLERSPGSTELELIAHLRSMWNNTGRGYPDIAALGGPSNSYCISAGSFMMGIYGTSAACPVAAAIIARLNAKRLSAKGAPLWFLNPWMYQNPLRCYIH